MLPLHRQWDKRRESALDRPVARLCRHTDDAKSFGYVAILRCIVAGGERNGMEEFLLGVRLLMMLSVANLAPIVVFRLRGRQPGARLDGGLNFFDRRPLLGPSKTVRGGNVGIRTEAQDQNGRGGAGVRVR